MQSKVQSLASDLAAKASSQQLAEAIATREPIIAEGGLAQSKVQNLTSDLAAKATTASLASGLAGKQDTIADGGLPQAKVAGLVSDLAAKASAGSLATVNANLTQAIVTSQTSLEVQMDTKVSTQELVAAIATREPTIVTLEMARVAGLATALAGTVDNTTFTEANAQRITVDTSLEASISANAEATTAALATKQAIISTVYPLPQSHVQGLASALSGKLETLTDAPGSGSSLLASGSSLRKLQGQGGVDVDTNITLAPDGNISSSEILNLGQRVAGSHRKLSRCRRKQAEPDKRCQPNSEH